MATCEVFFNIGAGKLMGRAGPVKPLLRDLQCILGGGGRIHPTVTGVASHAILPFNLTCPTDDKKFELTRAQFTRYESCMEFREETCLAWKQADVSCGKNDY